MLPCALVVETIMRTLLIKERENYKIPDNPLLLDCISYEITVCHAIVMPHG